MKFQAYMQGSIRITEYGVRVVKLNLSEEDLHMSKKQYLQQLSEVLRRFLFAQLAAAKRIYISSFFTKILCSGIITAFLKFVLMTTCVFESIPTVNKKIKW